MSPYKNPEDKKKYQRSEYQKEYARRYYQENKEKRLAAAKQWKEKNPERYAHNQTAYRKKNKERIVQVRKKYYLRNREAKLLDRLIYRFKSNTMGFCLMCGELNLIVLEDHHIFGRKISDTTITLCANHHRVATKLPMFAASRILDFNNLEVRSL